MAKQEIVTQSESEASVSLTVREVEAREKFNAETYAAQARWHNENERLVHAFQDAQEDNAARYRAEVAAAQRSYRNATTDIYEEG